METQISRYRRWYESLSGERQGQSSGGSRAKGRERYLDYRRDLTRAPDGSYPNEMHNDDEEEQQQQSSASASSSRSAFATKRPSAPPLEVNNPLSLSEKNPWHTYFASLAMLDQIKVDVERAFPDDERLQTSAAQSQLTRILFVWSLAEANTQVGYRQGMHEIAAICWLVCQDDRSSGEGAKPSFVEADTFLLFELIMRRARSWYEWKSRSAAVKLPISVHCDTIHNLLESTDERLASHLSTIGVEMQLFALRWVRLLFTRELPLDMALDLWDCLFEADPTLSLVDAICVVLLIRIRTQLLISDYSSAIQVLLNYPAYAMQDAPMTHLIEQAQLVDRSASQVTLMTLIQYNEENLSIPASLYSSTAAAAAPGVSVGFPPSSIPPSLSHLTKGISAQTLSAGLGRALYNVQKTVNAAYTAHAIQNENDGFPSSMIQGSARQYGAPQNNAELDRLKETNRQMGRGMTQVIDVLEKHWMDNVAVVEKKEKQDAASERDFLLCLTMLKHSKDVLLGVAQEFDPSIMLGPKAAEARTEDKKARGFGERFQRPTDQQPVVSTPSEVGRTPASTGRQDSAASSSTSPPQPVVPYATRIAKPSPAFHTVPERQIPPPSKVVIDDPLGVLSR